MIRRSVLSGNTSAYVEADPGGAVDMGNSAISGSGTGVSAGGTIRLWNSDASFNTTGLSGTVTTYGNNRLLENGTLGGILSAAVGHPIRVRSDRGVPNSRSAFAARRVKGRRARTNPGHAAPGFCVFNFGERMLRSDLIGWKRSRQVTPGLGAGIEQ